jgi:hypothetical protein
MELFENKNKEEGGMETNFDLKAPTKFEKIKAKVSAFFAIKKNRVIVISAVVVAILALSGLGYYNLRGHDEPAPIAANEETTPDVTVKPEEPVLFESPLDGTMADKETAARHPLAMTIENHTDARPQSGLDKANIVYEAIAEGGITRFLAVFGTNLPDKAGPIRSARTYFVDWAEGYNAFLAHVGGNIDALDKIQADKVQDLDQFRFSSCSALYCRDFTRKNVAIEHTMYGSVKALYSEAIKLKYDASNNFSRYKFKEEPTTPEELALLPTSQNVTVNFSSANYKVLFKYDKASNSYKRNQAGQPHLDAVSKTQLTAKNLIVMTVARKQIKTRINEDGYTMTTVGSGAAQFFIDGKETKGTWKKNSSKEREIFYDSTGQEITFNRGQFWICVIPPETGSSVTVE